MANRLDRFRIATDDGVGAHHDAHPTPSTKLRFLAATSLGWLHRAGRLPGRALHVALALKLQADLAGSPRVKSQRGLVEAFGVDRYAERRALEALAREGLIRIERHRGRRPIVHVLGAHPDAGVSQSSAEKGDGRAD